MVKPEIIKFLDSDFEIVVHNGEIVDIHRKIDDEVLDSAAIKFDTTSVSSVDEELKVQSASQHHFTTFQARRRSRKLKNEQNRVFISSNFDRMFRSFRAWRQ